MLKLDKKLKKDKPRDPRTSGGATGPHLDIRLNWFNVKLDPASILN